MILHGGNYRNKWYQSLGEAGCAEDHLEVRGSCSAGAWKRPIGARWSMAAIADGGRWCRKLRAGGLDRPMSCSGQGCARRGGRAGTVAGEGVEEAATSARDQIGDQTRGRPNRSERESIERCARVSYKGDGVALRTGCVDDVDGQGTTRLVHG
jgi:hypothetical protein